MTNLCKRYTKNFTVIARYFRFQALWFFSDLSFTISDEGICKFNGILAISWAIPASSDASLSSCSCCFKSALTRVISEHVSSLCCMHACNFLWASCNAIVCSSCNCCNSHRLRSASSILVCSHCNCCPTIASSCYITFVFAVFSQL